jgi:hypothetical protein
MQLLVHQLGARAKGNCCNVSVPVVAVMNMLTAVCGLTGSLCLVLLLALLGAAATELPASAAKPRMWPATLHKA